MPSPGQPPPPKRFVGLDIHKHFFVAVGVDRELEQIIGSQKIEWPDFESWIRRHLTAEDSVVIEMTTNTWEVYDALLPHVHSVTVVHPPHVKLQPGSSLKVAPGAEIKLDASGTTDPDGDVLRFEWWVYHEAGTLNADATFADPHSPTTSCRVPETPGELHVVLTVTDNGEPRLERYARCVITVGSE